MATNLFFFYWPFQGGASVVVYYFFHCMPLHVCPGEMFILDNPFGHFLGKKQSFLLVVF